MTDEKEPFRDRRNVRCPHCGDVANAWNAYELYGEIDRDITCIVCDKSFRVSAHVTIMFTSPPLI
jgi:hypothetical protein